MSSLELIPHLVAMDRPEQIQHLIELEFRMGGLTFLCDLITQILQEHRVDTLSGFPHVLHALTQLVQLFQVRVSKFV